MSMRVSAERAPAARPRPVVPRAPGGPHARVLALQRRAGNRAVAQLMRAPAAPELAPDLTKIKLPPSCLASDAHITRAGEVGPDRDVRRVTLSDGSVYLVRR